MSILNGKAIRLFLGGGITALLAACASIDTGFTDNKDWAFHTWAPLVTSQPDKAAALVEERLRANCRLDTIQLGARSFGQHLPDLPNDRGHMCADLAVLALYTSYKQGTVASHQPYLNQVLQDRMSLARYAIWTSLHGYTGRQEGWRTYAEISCDAFNIQSLPAVAMGRVDQVRAFEQQHQVSFRLPYWYDLQLTADPALAQRGDRLYKHYLCRLDSAESFQPEKQEAFKAAFVSDVTRLFGDKAAADLKKYLNDIYTPLSKVNRSFYQNSPSQEQYAQIAASRVALYENALKHLKTLGLDRVVYHNSAVFHDHLAGTHEAATARLKSWVR